MGRGGAKPDACRLFTLIYLLDTRTGKAADPPLRSRASRIADARARDYAALSNRFLDGDRLQESRTLLSRIPENRTTTTAADKRALIKVFPDFSGHLFER